MLPEIFNPRHKSLVRGNILVIASLLAAFPLSGFPHNRATLYLVIPALLAVAGTADTVRCIRRRWSFYHAGVLLCIYMDLMAVTLILVFLLYPYALWMTGTH
ncbi:permease [Granulicella aggregans]|uniref:permease n=1 Tax=Granulicella aggregans TaxID=474949 RepID=UPI0021DFB0F8|nr:permease [Granulicella aggregans]